MSLPTVTLVVTQRERFSLTKLSLDSILADYSSYPFQMIYVDGNGPPQVYQYLQDQASKHEFIKLIRQDRYLKSNEARNLALPLSEPTDYIVFIDNDVIVERGWLKPLVECAEEEQAAVVSPLIFQGDPQEQEIHVFGIDASFEKQPSGKNSFTQRHLLRGTKLRDLPQELHRCPANAVDIHCLLVRYSVMESIVLDEVFNNQDNVDLSLQVRALGRKILLEPSSVVTFPDPQLVAGFDRDDLPFYIFRWSEQSTKEILAYTREKWNVAKNDRSEWGRWKWTIKYRQVPARWVTSKGSLYWLLLRIAQTQWCPSRLRILIEDLVLKLTFPENGIPVKLSQVSQPAYSMK